MVLLPIVLTRPRRRSRTRSRTQRRGTRNRLPACRALKRRTARDVEKAIAVFEAAFAIAFGDVQQDRLSRSQPLIASVPMRPFQRPRAPKRRCDVVYRQTVYVEPIVVEVGLGHQHSLGIGVRVPGCALSTSTTHCKNGSDVQEAAVALHAYEYGEHRRSVTIAGLPLFGFSDTDNASNFGFVFSVYNNF